jgi:RHS repeat-associated protein
VDLAHSSAWRGHEVDVTGFYYLYNRYYDPVAGQWLSFDPMPNDRDPNAQSICGGDTINYVDPSGLLAKGATSGSMDSGVPISASSAFMLGYYGGGILSAAQQGFNGGRQIVANTFTFGGSDALGLTASRQFQGPDYTASRVPSTVGREALITAATLGSAQLARGGSMAALYTYRGLQIANAGRSGYAVGTGVNQVANGNKWGYLSIAGGSLGFAGSLSYAVANPALNSFSSLPAESTPRVFWSGGDAARDAAATWAKANGATTLEMTQAGQQLAQTTKGLDWLTQARPMWVDTSRSFAEGAVGDVHVFQSGTRGVSLESIWREVEYPTIMQNNNVNNIFYHVITPEGVTVVPH